MAALQFEFRIAAPDRGIFQILLEFLQQCLKRRRFSKCIEVGIIKLVKFAEIVVDRALQQGLESEQSIG